jgi:hypothetical protein
MFCPPRFEESKDLNNPMRGPLGCTRLILHERPNILGPVPPVSTNISLGLGVRLPPSSLLPCLPGPASQFPMRSVLQLLVPASLLRRCHRDNGDNCNCGSNWATAPGEPGFGLF